MEQQNVQSEHEETGQEKGSCIRECIGLFET